MKILVGIMRCIEHEFGQCLAAIDAQTLPAHDRFAVCDLPNKQAHDMLYQTFMDRSQEVDLFVKVDADMVLSRSSFFRECADRFTSDRDLQHLQVALDDWMTNRRIFGLHVYRSTHRWERNSESIFVDMVDKPHRRVDDRDTLAPAAIHCPNPAPFQAYHFGLHKGVKFAQTDRPDIHARYRATHWGHFQGLEQHYDNTGERRLALALLGFHDAVRYRWGPREVDFTAGEPRACFEHWNRLSDREIANAVKGHFPIGTRWLPHALRFELNRVRVGRDFSVLSLWQAVRRVGRQAYLREQPSV